MKIIEVFKARGHPNIRAEHPSTLEITKDPFVTLRGDCIVAVKSEKAALDLSSEFKRLAASEGSLILLTLSVDGLSDTVEGYGSPNLSFTDPRSLVFRKSEYVCGRTVMVRANKAARDLDRRLIRALRDPESEVTVTLTVSIT
ncbi:MAG: DUF371 domain-containing protein [Thermoprotei archaeon]|nr:MAG: DUF371 domain-containing protein [Thermoprotei archaeon]